ncbi:IclR family transcriptional regulator [Pseudoruegeria sp. M32A2M]|nr:IclR family transcriptional regulator [Pseudoruegeria sp. M32A2M]
MDTPRSGTVQAVDRALRLLEVLADGPGGAGLSELAGHVGLAPSTAHRLLTTLQQRGFVQHDTRSGRWLVGHRAFSVGEAFSLRRNLVAPAYPFLRQLRDRTRETANLGVIEAEEAVTIAQVESREIMRAIAPPGGSVPVLNSGMGKAIVATWPDAAIARLVERQGLRPMTSKSLGSREAVMREIQRIRSQGFAVDNEEYVVGMRCVAAVVWSATAEPIAAISVSGLAARLTADATDDIAKEVRSAADQLTRAIGGTPQ